MSETYIGPVYRSLSFEDWLGELYEIIEEHYGWSSGEGSHYCDAYDDGMTPADAWDEELRSW